MSVHKVKGGYENIGAAGGHGVFKSKEGAEKQKAAMFARGWTPGKKDGGEVNHKDELHKKIIQACLDHQMAGAAHDVVHAILDHEAGEAGETAEDDDHDLPHDGSEVDESSDAPEVVDVEAEPTEDDDDDEDEHTKRLVAAYIASRK